MQFGIEPNRLEGEKFNHYHIKLVMLRNVCDRYTLIFMALVTDVVIYDKL